MHLGKGEKKKNGDKQVYFFLKSRLALVGVGMGWDLGDLSLPPPSICTHSHLESWVGRGWLIKIWGPMTSRTHAKCMRVHVYACTCVCEHVCKH